VALHQRGDFFATAREQVINGYDRRRASHLRDGHQDRKSDWLLAGRSRLGRGNEQGEVDRWRQG